MPRSLPACLPYLWRHVLFPGRSGEPGRPRGIALAMLIVLPGLLLYPSMNFHLFEPDEGRYAQIPREMLEHGDWIVPWLQGEPYLDKPPLFYWMVMASYSVFGIHAWAARLVPALAVHACILLVYLLGRRIAGERPAFWGALLLGLAPGFLSVGRLLVLDSLLSLWVTLGLLSGFEAIRGARFRWSWWLLASLACGLGMLTKGPIALVLTAAPLAGWLWLMGQMSQLTWRRWLAFLALAVLVAVPWYLAVCVRLPEFAGYFFWKHNVLRFAAAFDHLEPVWYFVPILLAGMPPAVLLLPGLLRFLCSADPGTASRRGPELGFFLLAGGWCVLFFSLSASNLPTYIMPAFPMLALAAGLFLAVSRWGRSSWAPAGAVLAFALLGLGHHLVLPWYAWFRSPMSRPEMVRSCCGDPAVPVVCYPRTCDSVAFYLGRNDFLNYRSKQTNELLLFMMARPRTVVLFTHRHSRDALKAALPPCLRMQVETPLYDSARAGLDGWRHLLASSPLGGSLERGTDGLCYLAVIERIAP